MKIPCPQHGAHFGDEIDEIVSCNFVWARWNLAALPEPNRRELAEWYTDIPSDKIFIETGWGIGVGLNGEYIGYENAFANQPGYEEMSEEERRQYQKDMIKKQYLQRKQRSLWKRLLNRK